MAGDSNELVDELTFAWLEMHKKSALTYVVLQQLAEQSLWSKDLEMLITEQTGWTINERALYRILRRLEKQGVLAHSTQAAERTGAERKIYQITDDGRQLLANIHSELHYLT